MSLLKKIIGAMFILSIIIGAFVVFVLFKKNSNNKENAYLYIKNGASYENVLDSLTKMNVLNDLDNFKKVAKIFSYENKVKPGRYLIKPSMSSKELIQNLKMGNQAPVNFILKSNIRTLENLASHVGKKLDIDSAKFLSLLKSSETLEKFQTDTNNIITYFIPNTYQLYWNTSEEKFLERMKTEHEKFWTKERVEKLEKTGLTKQQVYTMASIVEEETNMKKDKYTIAGVYVNRINRNIPLQADPTLKFALKDFAIKRVLNVHKLVESPFNTYKYSGLTPGPICIPNISSIDAVLDYEKHDYIFFCAKEDFSGYSNFAVDLATHEANARRYQEALNNRGIFK